MASYSYDGNGLRVAKLVGNTRTVSIYAGTKLISEYEDLASASYNPGTTPGPAPADSLSVLLYQHGDHLTTRLTTENDGGLSNEQGHYPFGESWYASSTTTKWQFTSYERDAESTLDYAIFRYNNSRLGRFMTPDLLAGSIFDPQSLNRYAYTRNDPINLIDPLGLESCEPGTEDCVCNDIGTVTKLTQSGQRLRSMSPIRRT